MLPHGTMLAMTNNNIPAIHLVSIPWDGYETEYTTEDNIEYSTEDAADNFKTLARRNGIKVSSPGKEKTRDLSPSATEFVPRSAATSEVLAESRPLTPLPQTSLSKPTNTSPLSEDKKLFALFQEVLNEKTQQFKILEDCMKERDECKSTIISLSEAKDTLKEEVEKLTGDLTKLKERNSMLSDEVEALTERLIESGKYNTRLQCEVAAMKNRIQEMENGQESERTMVTSLFSKLNESEAEKERAWNVVDGLSNKCDMLSKDNERKHTDLINLKEQLEQIILEKACIETKAAMFEEELRKSKLDNDRLEARIGELKCELNEYREKEKRAKELNQSTATTVSSEKKGFFEKKMDSLDNISAVDGDDDQNWTVVQKKTKGAKSTSHPYKSQSCDKKVKRSQSLDDTILGGNNGFCFADKKYPQKKEKVIPPLMPEGWELECPESRLSNVHSGLPSKPQKPVQKSFVNAEVPQKSPITADVKTPQSDYTVTPTLSEVNSDSLNTGRHIPSVPRVQEPTKQVKPSKQVTTSIESSRNFSSTTKTTTTTETFISENINISSANTIHQTPCNPCADSVYTKPDVDSTLSNGKEGGFAHPLFDPAIIDMSILQAYTQAFEKNTPVPGLKTTPPGFTSAPISGLQDKSTKQEKHKTAKENLSSFDNLMTQLREKFPSRTRNELMMLLKLAKATFGDQGFRKKKIEEIVKRVGEIIVPENTDNTEKLATQTCSICHKKMENKTVRECGHAFHQKCVNDCTQTGSTCPLCLSNSSTDEDFPNFA